MSAGMAGVIAAHPLWQGQMGDISAAECPCGQNHGAFSALGGTAAALDFGAIHAAHVAEELAKAGYGLVQEAKAGALREAAKELARLPYVKPGAAGRAEYERGLAVRRGETDKWLHARADLIDALADPEGHALVKAIHDRKAEA